MVFANTDELVHMGGHGPYVWAAYGATIAALAWLTLAPLARHRTLLGDIARRDLRDRGGEG